MADRSKEIHEWWISWRLAKKVPQNARYNKQHAATYFVDSRQWETSRCDPAAQLCLHCVGRPDTAPFEYDDYCRIAEEDERSNP